MKTRYMILTKNGEWKLIKSDKPIRNIKVASEVAKEEVTKIKLANIIDIITRI